MAKKTRIKYKNKPSNIPYIMAGLAWAVLVFVLPLHKYVSYPILLLATIVVFVLLRKLKVFKDQSIRYEEELSYEDMEIEDILSSGKSFVNSLNTSRMKIKKVEVREDIENVIRISNLILEDVKKDPKGLKQIRKFISYYLPMIDKMVKAYIDFEKTTSSPQIEESKLKIENMLKTVQKAFTSLFDSLHEDETIDISSDITVLESLMAQEGFINK